MIARNTTPFLLNLSPSDVHEPGISNDEFPGSLDQIGVWLRVLAAHDSLERYASPGSTLVQRARGTLEHLSSAWSPTGGSGCRVDRVLRLVKEPRPRAGGPLFSDLCHAPEKTRSRSEIVKVHAKLATDGPGAALVDQRAFFREVAKLTDAAIVEFFLGYKWRAVPSVKLIPKRHIKVWTHLPEEFRRIAGSFDDASQIPRITLHTTSSSTARSS